MKYDHELDQREYWQSYLRERSLETLAERFNISTVSVMLGESRPIQKLTDQQNAELQKLRREYHEAKKRHMSKYRLQAIADRHGVKMRQIYRAGYQRRMRRIEEGYGRRIAA